MISIFGVEQTVFGEPLVRKSPESLGQMADDTVWAYKVETTGHAKVVNFHHLQLTALQFFCDGVYGEKRETIRF